MMEKNNLNRLAVVIGIIFLISLLPLLVMSRYNQSWADDYSYGILAHEAWKNTHSLLRTLKAAIKQVKISYMEWQGTYSGIFFMALQPGIFGEGYYQITTYLMLALLIGSIMYFMKVIMINYLKSEKSVWWIISFVILILMIQCIPDPIQAFYWFNGSMYYTGFFSLFVIMSAIYLTFIQKETMGKRQRVILIGISIFLGGIIGGGNFVGGLLALEIGIILMFFAFIYKKKAFYMIFPSYLVMTIGFAINVLAPGNAVRQATFMEERKGAFQSIYYSFRLGIEYIDEWTKLYLILAFMFILPFLWMTIKKVKGIEKVCQFPLAMIFFSYCIFSSSFTPTLYATGTLGQNLESAGRVQNIRYLLLILLILLDVIWVLGWLKGKLAEERRFLSISSKEFNVYYGFIIISTAFMLICPKDFNELTSVSAIYSYYTGELQEYIRETKERREILNSEVKVVKLKSYKARPRLLYYYNDIQLNEHDWKNETIARWYGKELIFLENEEK